MKVVKLIGEVREGKGKSAAKKLRDAGLVPCNLYGGNEQVHFSAYLADFKNLVYTPNTHLVDLQLGSKNVTAVLQEVQFHPVSDFEFCLLPWDPNRVCCHVLYFLV